jgi:hypothetical protein
MIREGTGDQLTVVLATVHYTSVTDKAKTAQIIANGAHSLLDFISDKSELIVA